MKRTAYAHWEGSLKEGRGTLTTQSGVLNKTSYSYKARFKVEEEPGTNPEELLAATHAGCFTMEVCAALTKKGLDPQVLDTEATLTLEDMTITAIHLSIKGSVSGITESDFNEVTKGAEKNCIISKALKIPITSDAKLNAA